MTDPTAAADLYPTTDPEAERPGRLRWWKEVVYIVAFYVIYSAVRNTFGSAAVSPETAQRNAERIIDAEKAVGLYFEQDLQEAFLGAEWFIRAWNIFYGTFHFVATAGVLIYVFRRFGSRYPRWRNALAWTTGLAIVGFATFPLMPPRLMPDSYGYVDTLVTVGGLWSFSEGPIADVSNQYAAMPSLHFGWSTWCMLAMLPVVRSRWAKALWSLYPVATLFAIVVTANHFWLDAVGGAAVLALGYLLGSAQEEWRSDRQARREVA